MNAGALPVTVVIPARNAEHLLHRCLQSVTASAVDQIIVVDGESTDNTVAIARQYGAEVLSDRGGGLPFARALGAQESRNELVALVDADVELPAGALRDLIDEFHTEGYDALQAGLISESDDNRYWGEALAYHHRTGRSRYWFGLVATLFRRDHLLNHGFNQRYVSGEDIEMRWRLRNEGSKIGVSRQTEVTHRFADGSFGFALDQFRADGEGLGRMVRDRPLAGLRLVALPAAAALRGMGLSILRGEIRWIPYFAVYGVMNYVAMARGVLESEPPDTLALGH